MPVAPVTERFEILGQGQWLTALRERSGWQKGAVALANKNARILWAVMTRGDAFDPNHLSVKTTGA